MFTWWKTFGIDRGLFIIVVQYKGQVIGIAPFLVRQLTRFLVPLNRIEFLGSGENEADEICSLYLDLIVDPDYRQQAIEAIARELMNNQSAWDEIHLSDTRASARNTGALLKVLETSSGLSVQTLGESPCPYIELPHNWESLAESTRINAREQLNRKQRGLERAGHVEYAVYSGEEITQNRFDQFIRLHQARWQATDQPGCFSSQAFTRFHLDALDHLKSLGVPRLFFLRLNGIEIAARYCFVYKDRIYDYLPGLDPNVQQRYSPGQLLLAFCIRHSIENGLRYFDFFKGRRGTYKYQWTDKEDQVLSYRISRRNAKVRLLDIPPRTKGGLKKLAATIRKGRS
jgi:CelD/BcsL family acetyltransferase involved in cellulose biosynthesis